MQVYGICIRTLHLPVISVMIIRLSKEPCQRQISAPSVPSCVCANDLSFKICVVQVGQESTSRRDRWCCHAPSSCENAVKDGSSLKPQKLVGFKHS